MTALSHQLPAGLQELGLPLKMSKGSQHEGLHGEQRAGSPGDMKSQLQAAVSAVALPRGGTDSNMEPSGPRAMGLLVNRNPEVLLVFHHVFFF